jgi:hypothetical protein
VERKEDQVHRFPFHKLESRLVRLLRRGLRLERASRTTPSGGAPSTTSGVGAARGIGGVVAGMGPRTSSKPSVETFKLYAKSAEK